MGNQSAECGKWEIHTDIGAKAGFREHKPAVADHGEADFIRDDAAVAARDVRERPGVHQNGGAFQGLH